MDNEICWPYFDPDFDNMSERITPSCRVCIDNNSKEDCTVIKVDRVNKEDLLLEIVQIITDLNLSITKGYISSDAEWFMDVFHVKDKNGNKLRDQTVLNKIQQGIGSARVKSKPILVKPSKSKSKSKSLVSKHTAIEMTTTDRPGLLSEISAVLTDLHCNIVEAHAWCHNAQLACVVHISDQSSLSPIDDPNRLASIEEHLTMVLGAKSTLVEIDLKQQELKTTNVIGEGIKMITNVERRLHQLMLSNRDFDSPAFEHSTSPRSPLVHLDDEEAGMKAIIYIEGCHERGYSIISVECKDRARVVFDTLCTLIDMEYVIFHGFINTRDGHAFQEYFIRHRDSTTLQTEAEKDRVIKCLEAAVERRVCQGIKVEVCAKNRVGLLSDITRLLRENELTVVRADIATQGEKAIDAFYVRDLTGKNIDMDFMESVQQEMSLISFNVKNEITPSPSPSPSPSPRYHFSLVGMIKFHLDRFSHI